MRLRIALFVSFLLLAPHLPNMDHLQIGAVAANLIYIHFHNCVDHSGVCVTRPLRSSVSSSCAHHPAHTFYLYI